ncbi:LOW QUALITY PROTEIN: hypothetical protein HID58_078702 [Brassica napus]|uniref:CSD2 domain-containing protein n=1 Tax=Brassica napus TaxID=3708 RepID=A0ABQ7YUU4_BRANA|nr:LOW QUALITY PROTEIN: hypothetical protein HID58_078702 [Brassica napus]
MVYVYVLEMLRSSLRLKSFTGGKKSQLEGNQRRPTSKGIFSLNASSSFRVLQQMREAYLRDDIYCGAFSCKSCDIFSCSFIDLLENQAIDNVVVLSVVLDEVKNRNRSMYNRIRALCSNQAKQFYVFSNHVHNYSCPYAMKHLADTSQVLLVTNDRENERKATEEGISAETKPMAYVESIIKENSVSILLKLMLEARVLWSLEPMSLPGGTAHSLFVSKDRRIPRFALTLDSFRTFLDMRIVVAVDSWGCQSRYPSGHYVRPIGKIVLSCLPPLPWSVSAEDVSDPVRQDLRHLLVFSVDPSGYFPFMLEFQCTRDMVLLADIFSLRADVERLAFSSIIKSSAAFSYVEALARMDDRLCTGLISVIYFLQPIDRRTPLKIPPLTSRNDRKKKTIYNCYVLFELCALASAEVKFQIAAETHDPLDIGMFAEKKKLFLMNMNNSFLVMSLCTGYLPRRYEYTSFQRCSKTGLNLLVLPIINLNYRHRNAQMASRTALSSTSSEETCKDHAETRVAKLRSNGFILFVPKYEIEGPVYVTAKGEKRGGDWYVDEENQKIV